jgi:hypothetical protein
MMSTTDALHLRAIATKMMTVAAAVGTAVGSGIPRVTQRPHAVAEKSAVRLAATTVTMMTVGDVQCPPGTMKAGSPAHARVTMMTTTGALHVRAMVTKMMTDVVVAGTAAGTAIPTATPKLHGAAGKSAAVLTRVIKTMMTTAAVRCRRGTTKAGSPARGRATMMTMTTAAAAAGMAAGTAMRKAIPRRHAAVADRLSV